MSRFTQALIAFKTNAKSFLENNQVRKILIFSLSLVTAISIITLVTTICVAKYPDYIYIENEDDLEKIRDHLDGDFVFTKQNINIEKEWRPIGSKEKPFTGTILGNNCTISFSRTNFNFLQTEDESINYFGFFGGNSGTIKNLQFYLHDMNLEAPNTNDCIFGCVSAYNSGSISNCTIIQASGSINISSFNQAYIGAFCGAGSHNFVKLKSSANFNIFSNNNIAFGGLVGLLNGKTDIWECESTGRVSISGSCNIVCGGLIGHSEEDAPTKITNVSSRNTFAATNDVMGQYGGIIGKSDSTVFEIKNTYSNCNITNCLNIKSSNFICEGIFNVVNCVSNPNFINRSDNYTYGSFAYETLGSVLFKNCFFTKIFEWSFDDYGIYVPLSDLSLEQLNWDNKIWRKNSDGSFKLV